MVSVLELPNVQMDLDVKMIWSAEGLGDKFCEMTCSG